MRGLRGAKHSGVAVAFEGADVEDRTFVESLQARVIEESLVEQDERAIAHHLEGGVEG